MPGPFDLFGGPTQQSADPYQAALAQALTFNGYFPQYANTTAQQAQQVGQTLQDANNALAPQNQALQNALFGQYAPQLYQTGNLLNNIQLQGGVNNASNLMSGAGGQLLSQAIAADQQANPQYYSTRANNANAINTLLNSASGALNTGGSGLSGSEQADVERSLNQQDASRGLLNSPSQTATVANAMNFGRAGQQALQQKQSALSNAIGTATSFLPSSQSGVNSFGIASGQATNAANPGAGQFQGVAGSQSNTAYQGALNQGNSLAGSLGNTAASAMTANTQLPSKAQSAQDSAMAISTEGAGPLASTGL